MQTRTGSTFDYGLKTFCSVLFISSIYGPVVTSQNGRDKAKYRATRGAGSENVFDLITKSFQKILYCPTFNLSYPKSVCQIGIINPWFSIFTHLPLYQKCTKIYNFDKLVLDRAFHPS